jgi:hypothetical protein
MTRPAVARAPVFGKRGPVNYMGGNGPPSPDVIRMMPGPIIDTPWQLHHQINVGRAVSRYKNIACIQQSVPSVPGSFYHSSNPLDSFWWIPVSQSGIEFPVIFLLLLFSGRLIELMPTGSWWVELIRRGGGGEEISKFYRKVSCPNTFNIKQEDV